MPIAVFDPFSGIAGDMLLGALVDVGLDPEFIRTLPERLGLHDIGVSVEQVSRGDIACHKVDFEIPRQPHGRHLREIRALVDQAALPEAVRVRSMKVFEAITVAEGSIHGLPPERVHLHEVGAVDAILDVVGSVWGLEQLGVTTVYCGPLALGDGYVEAAHGLLPVPAPATLRLLEGLPVHSGPPQSGELVTPTGAALVRVLSKGLPPAFVPIRSGFGAGTRNPKGRANALRVILAESAYAAADGDLVEDLALLAADVDDLSGERLAECTASLRADPRVRDVVLLPVQMKKGRPGARIEVLCAQADAAAIEDLFFRSSSTIGIRRTTVRRRALARVTDVVRVGDQSVRVKSSRLPNGEWRRKPEADDLVRAARALGVSTEEARGMALASASLSTDACRDAGGDSELRTIHPAD